MKHLSAAVALSFRTGCLASDRSLMEWKSRSLPSNAIKADTPLQGLPSAREAEDVKSSCRISRLPAVGDDIGAGRLQTKAVNCIRQQLLEWQNQHNPRRGCSWMLVEDPAMVPDDFVSRFLWRIVDMEMFACGGDVVHGISCMHRDICDILNERVN